MTLVEKKNLRIADIIKLSFDSSKGKDFDTIHLPINQGLAVEYIDEHKCAVVACFVKYIDDNVVCEFTCHAHFLDEDKILAYNMIKLAGELVKAANTLTDDDE